MRRTNGALILTFGILSLMGCGCILGIPAWVLGNNSLELMNSGEVGDEERSIVNAGRILGIVSTFVALICVVAWISSNVFFHWLWSNSTISVIQSDLPPVIWSIQEHRHSHPKEPIPHWVNLMNTDFHKAVPECGKALPNRCGKLKFATDGKQLTISDGCEGRTIALDGASPSAIF